jgi:cytochrome c-type biogenesis protein CcmF
METEDFFLIFACLLLFFDLIQMSKAKPREKKKLEHGFYASTLACGLIVASYFMLVQAFLKDDFTLREVYSYSSSNLPTLYKLYATWGGTSGSMLFLTFLTAIAYFVYRFKTYEKRSVFRIAVYGILDFILLSFLLITLMNSPFERFPATPMDGRGLNPLLQTFWMVAHPPVVFIGYVFVIFAFVLTLASMSTREKRDRGMFKMFLQVAWLTSTLGIAIGGLWAYEVLGWGGYWAWDPVETASLLPWLALTAYFHLGPSAKRGGSLAGELTILIAFSAVFFTTALTRGGLLVSVHAFGASPVGPALLVFTLCMIIYFFYLRRKIQKPLYALDIDKSSLFSISLTVGYWSLIFLTLVSFWGVTFPLIAGVFQEIPPSTGIEYYNNWSFPFTLAFVAALIGCNIPVKLNLKKYAMLVSGALGVGAALALVRQPTPNLMANLGLPLLILALVVIGYKTARIMPKMKKSFPLLGRNLLHLAIIIILIGVFFSSTTKLASGEIPTRPNTTINTLGVRMELKNFTVYTGTGRVHLYKAEVPGGECYPEYSALKMDVTIEYGGNTYHESLWIRLYTAYGIVCTPLIIPTWTGDLYIHMHHTESIHNTLVSALMGQETYPEDLIVTVEIIPMVHLVWAGIMLLGIGMTLPLIKEIVRSSTRSQPRSKGG